MRHGSILFALLIAGLLLTAVAWLRGAEYDEQYTLFLTGSVVRPVWPSGVIAAGDIQALQATQSGFATIARDLRATDVHPPLYFWTVAVWRRLAGDSLFEARLASVLFSVATLGLVAMIARSVGIPAAPAVLLTVGCYGFAYTGAIARGFAMAQMLSVAGVAMLIIARSRLWYSLTAGAVLGAATFSNYLAVFVASAALFWLMLGPRRRVRVLPALVGFAVWLPADLWFFLAQRRSRAGQFASFQPISAIGRLVKYAAANLFGGLPLYVDGIARTAVTAAVVVLLVALAALTIRHRHRIATPEIRLLLVMVAAALPIGLMLLGLAFDNTPIELRYLAFATPFTALLLAAALPPLRPSRRPRGPGHRAARPHDTTGDDAAGTCDSDRGGIARAQRRGAAAARQRRRGHRRRLRGRITAFAAPAGRRRTRNACGGPRAYCAVSSRRLGAAGSGRREPCDASRHARRPRRSLLALGI